MKMTLRHKRHSGLPSMSKEVGRHLLIFHEVIWHRQTKIIGSPAATEFTLSRHPGKILHPLPNRTSPAHTSCNFSLPFPTANKVFLPCRVQKNSPSAFLFFASFYILFLSELSFIDSQKSDFS